MVSCSKQKTCLEKKAAHGSHRGAQKPEDKAQLHTAASVAAQQYGAAPRLGTSALEGYKVRQEMFGDLTTLRCFFLDRGESLCSNCGFTRTVQNISPQA